jgi:hypothetical protein
MNNYWATGFVPTVEHKKNTVSNWSGTDTEANFKRNPKPIYTADSIVYKYNSHGYRTEEFDFKNPAVLCLGCSFTEGIGVAEQDTWAKLLDLPYPVYNMGIGGSSGDAVARILTNVADVFDIHAVFILWPQMFRYEVYNDGAAETVVPTDSARFTAATLTDVNFYNIRQRNRNTVELLSLLYNFKVVEHTVEECAIVDRGRDNHPGTQWHKNMAQIFMEKYDSSTI